MSIQSIKRCASESEVKGPYQEPAERGRKAARYSFNQYDPPQVLQPRVDQALHNLRTPTSFRERQHEYRTLNRPLDQTENREIDKQDENGDTQLHIAIRKQEMLPFYHLLEEGARIDLRNGAGYYPLHIAAMTNNRYFIGALLQHGADPQVRQDEGLTPLELAMRENKPAAIDELTPSPYKAALEGDLETLRTFLSRRGAIGIDEKDAAQRSLIGIAVQTANLDLAHFLMKRNVDLEKSSKYGSSILFEVVEKRNPLMLDSFWKQGLIPIRCSMEIEETYSFSKRSNKMTERS